MTKLPMIILIGKTASGKDTVAQELIQELNAKIITGVTTRPKRPGEVHGVDHYFTTNEKFDRFLQAGELVGTYEVDVFDNDGNPAVWRYGIPSHRLGVGKILVSNPDSLESILRAQEQSVVICIEASVEERRERYRSRNPYASAKELERRITEEESAFARAYEKGLIDFVVDNTESLDETIRNIKIFLEQL